MFPKLVSKYGLPDAERPHGADLAEGVVKTSAMLLACASTLFSATHSVAAPPSGTYTTLSSFSVRRPHAPFANLLRVNSALYGTGSGGQHATAGGVFAFHPAGGVETTIWVIKGYYGRPLAPLTDVGGKLFGTTTQGGTYGYGTIFSLDPKTKAVTTIFSFPDSVPTSGFLDVHGLLYGLTTGVLYSFDPATSTYTPLHVFGSGHDGQDPSGSLILSKGRLIGTTSYGGDTTNCTRGCGTVFSFDLKSGKEKVVYAFQGGTDGASPSSGVIDVNGMLFGTTTTGGPPTQGFQCGTVFSVDPATGSERVVYTFRGGSHTPDGCSPQAGLLDFGGLLYGTTISGGGSTRSGILYSVDPLTGAEKILHTFDALSFSDGGNPEAGLTEYDGKLYGTTTSGGDHGDGTIYSYLP